MTLSSPRTDWHETYRQCFHVWKLRFQRVCSNISAMLYTENNAGFRKCAGAVAIVLPIQSGKRGGGRGCLNTISFFRRIIGNPASKCHVKCANKTGRAWNMHRQRGFLCFDWPRGYLRHQGTECYRHFIFLKSAFTLGIRIGAWE